MHLAESRQTAALTIAGSDSGGNAGIQADIRAFHTFGLHACTVVAALTAQNPFAVTAVQVPDTAFLEAQLDAVLPVYTLGAAKTGMLATKEVIETVAAKLARFPTLPLVADPVMVATSGARLIRDDAIDAVRQALLPRATVATPNLPEAEVLLGRSISSPEAMVEAARELAAQVRCAVLIKGGHAAQAEAVDILAMPSGTTIRYSAPVIQNPLSTHGTGCSLSAAIAAAIAMGNALPDAVALGKAYVYESIRTALPVGPRATVLGTPDGTRLLHHPDIHREVLA